MLQTCIPRRRQAMSELNDPDSETILALFERHRAVPHSPFEETHFLDYLLARPKGKSAVRNSFSGLRRFNRFIGDVQMHFGICFSLHDREANYSLEAFISRVKELKASHRSSLTSFRNQDRAGFGWGAVLVLNVLFGCVIVALLKFSHAFAGALAFLQVLANLWIGFQFMRYRGYRKGLAFKIKERASART